MSPPADPRLQRLLGGDDLAPLRRRLRRRFERAAPEDPVETIRVDNLSGMEHAALASLLGRPQRPAGSLQIDVRRLDAALRDAGIATSLRDALERLDGPIAHLATLRQQAQALWSEAVGSCAHGGLAALLRTPAGIGLLKRLSRQNPAIARQLCHRAEIVLQRLPARGITRSQLAADALGDAHALDAGQATATLVLMVWRNTAVPEGVGDDDERAATPDAQETAQGAVERDRDIWARAGVLVNELARPALFLNLPAHPAEGQRWPCGEPTFLSLRSLLRAPPIWDVTGRTIHVCENPNLVAIAADRWGPACAPLVCTDGMPGATQRCLLSQLAQAGARLVYHGDFDWAGVTIGNHVVRTHDAQPWRFSAADYLAAVRLSPSAGYALAGNAIASVWDENLAPAMQRHGIAIAEEAVAESLLQDLGGCR